MIKSFKIVNPNLEELIIELRNPEKSGFLIRSVRGLTPVKANISTVDYATMDGAVYNSSRLETRNIVFDIIFYGTDIEYLRLNLYKYFKIKTKIDIYIETDVKTVFTTGYVESNEIDIFSDLESCQISIVCPNPYLFAINTEMEHLGSTIEKFYFEFYNEQNTNNILFGSISNEDHKEIYYDGDYEVGFVSEINVVGNPESDINILTIENTRYNGEILQIEYEFQPQDSIYVSTEKSNMYAYMIRNGENVNLINYISRSDFNFSYFPVIHYGDNDIKISTNLNDPSILSSNIKYKKIYGGI